jgi:hypothetical protein
MLPLLQILRGRGGWRVLRGAVLLAPAAWILTMVIGTYAEFPYADQHLTLLPFLEKVFDGDFTIGDFFAPAGIGGAHITAVPKSIFTLLALASGWTIKLELFVSLALALATFGMLAHIAAPQGNEPNTGWWPTALTSLLLFSLLQINNWLWGYALMYFVVNAQMVAAAALLYGALKSYSRTKLVFALALCGTASFSMAQGMFTWFAVLPSIVLLAIQSTRIREVLGLWVVATVITWAALLSLVEPQSAAAADLLSALIDSPVNTITNVFRFLGVHFVYAIALVSVPGELSLTVTTGAGVMALVAFCASAAFLVTKSTKADKSRAVTWISIGLFSMIYAGVNTLGRHGWVESMSSLLFANFSAITSMYSTTLVLFPIATVHLVFLALRARSTDEGRVLKTSRTVQVVGACLLGLFMVNFAIGVMATQRSRGFRVSQASCVELARYLAYPNTCAMGHAPIAVNASAMYERLDRLGLREIRRGLLLEESPPQPVGSIDRVEFISPMVREYLPTRSMRGHFENLVVVAGTLTPSTDPKGYRSIALSHDGVERFFALGSVADDESWKVEFSGDLLPTPGVIHAWLYDREKGKFLRLRGKAELIRGDEGLGIKAPSRQM